ncbi:hypothetical protein Dred_2802 [Desulforamulus reducens MI-1]|uniref:Uncharacterized protein n=1 Tax=Desulforamulus reducens (strain ATCC BAA-1160 / DSM 100696 / MI-1) TaxID=349161 RepID=A4J8A3_DESRM|nr:hypothetical protein [Desulforamulus reducens]ABO51306.1 hypothetical protein Dred_2802 [Desulforamulus reducens MI-1]
MNQGWCRVEEIIDLTGDSAKSCFSQAMHGDIRIKGKFMRDNTGKLRPVLVKTSYHPSIEDEPLFQMPKVQEPMVIPTALSAPLTLPSKPVQKNNGLTFLVNLIRKWLFLR